MGTRGRKNKAGTQVAGLLCKDEKTRTFPRASEGYGKPTDPYREDGREGATWYHQDKGLGGKGTCHIKRGTEVGLLPS